MKTNNPKVSIIIVNWNGINDSIECLESLKKLTYKNYKIILIDNGSIDNQADKLIKRFPYVKLIKNIVNTGFCFANNQGIKFALKNKADYILLLNNDTTVASNFLDILIDYAEKHSTVGILSPKINYYYNPDTVWAMGGKMYKFLGIGINIGKGHKSTQYTNIIEPDFASGCALLVRHEVITRVGMLDLKYFAYYEDADFCYRAKKIGYKISTIPQSIVWHKKSASAGLKGKNKFSPLQCYYQTRNTIVFAKKHLSFYEKIPLVIFTILIRFPYMITHAQNYKCISQILHGFIDGITTTCL